MSPADSKVYRQQVNMFIEVMMNNCIGTNNVAPILVMNSNNFPGGFDFLGSMIKVREDAPLPDVKEIYAFTREAELNASSIVLLRDKAIDVITRNSFNVTHGCRIIPNEVKDPEWLNALFHMICYIIKEKNDYTRNTFLTHTSAGYTVKVLTPVAITNSYIEEIKYL